MSEDDDLIPLGIPEEVEEPPPKERVQLVHRIGKTEIVDQAKSFAPSMLDIIIEIANDETASTKDRLTAAREVLDRAIGKPTQGQTPKKGVKDAEKLFKKLFAE